ncbi:MAG: hypothetical protein ABR606_08035 [Vicinamibacterales bacterium]
MTPPAVLEPTALLAPPLVPETVDDRWARWIERGRAHDRALRGRWFEGLTLAGVLLLLGTAIVLGLG